MGIFGGNKEKRELEDLRTKFASVQSHSDMLQNKLNGINKSFTNSVTRPSLTAPYMSTDTGAKLGIYPFPLIMIQEMEKNTDSLRIPIESLISEMFKNGFEIKEKYKYKCQNCNKEFQFKPEPEDNLDETKGEINTFNEMHPGAGNNPHADKNPFSKEKPGDDEDSPEESTEFSDTIKSLKKGGYSRFFAWRNRINQYKIVRKDYDDKNLVCDDCGSNDLRRPDPVHRKVLDMLLNNPINGNMQVLEDLAIQCEFDYEICDNMYCLILKTYDIDDSTHEIVDWRVAEIMRADPAQVAMIVDSDGRPGYDDNGNRVYVCPRFEHRNHRLIKPYCDKCGTRALRALVEVNSVYSIGIPQPKRVIYGEGEIIWKAGKYMPGLVYGYSPIFAIWSKVTALMHMDEYVRKYFDKMRPPRGMLVMASRNYEGFKKSWDALQKKATEDPYEIYPVLVETDRGGKNMAQWIDFTGSLRELEFVEVRNELRRIIAAMYRVPPLWYGESQSSGNAADAMPVLIMNRTVQRGQNFLKRTLLDKLCKLVGVDDWHLQLKSGEDTDELRKEQIQGVKIGNAEAMMRMGFEVTQTHNGEFKFSKNPTQGQQPTTETGGGNLSSAKTDPKEEVSTDNQGEHLSSRPSDVGGMAQGHPASGQGTSPSKKSARGKKGINTGQ